MYAHTHTHTGVLGNNTSHSEPDWWEMCQPILVQIKAWWQQCGLKLVQKKAWWQHFQPKFFQRKAWWQKRTYQLKLTYPGSLEDCTSHLARNRVKVCSLPCSLELILAVSLAIIILFLSKLHAKFSTLSVFTTSFSISSYSCGEDLDLTLPVTLSCMVSSCVCVNSCFYSHHQTLVTCPHTHTKNEQGQYITLCFPIMHVDRR